MVRRRSGLAVLPIDISPYGVVKFNGLGVPPHGGEPARLPGRAPYDRSPGLEPDPHFGIDDAGEFVLRLGTDAPLGGITLRAAIREFEAARQLQDAGVPSVGGVAVFRTSTVFGEAQEPLGISVTGRMSSDDRRASALVPGWGADGDLGVGESLKQLGEAYRAFGQLLHRFHDAGWCRYSAHPDNLGIEPDGTIVLVDLDTVEPMIAYPPERAELERVRDGMSGLYNLACGFFLPGVMSLVDDAMLRRHEPFSAYLEGWAPGVPGIEELGAAVVTYVIEAREELRRFADVLAEPARGERLYRAIRHDRDLTYAWMFRSLYRLRQHHAPLPVSLRVLDERLTRFAGRGRMERLRRLEP